MKGRSLLFLFFAAVTLVLASCGGGTASTGSVGAANCDGGQALCVTSCNLGCGPTGCSISDIAVNQPLVFTFNQPVDPATVNRSTFQLKTARGKEPVGAYLVQKNNVFFVPDIEVIGNEVFFGFEDRETYTLTIPAGNSSLNTIRSLAGAPIGKGFSCRLNVSLGIKDFDGRAPRAKLVLPEPAQRNAAPRDSLIIVEFSELVDTQSLLQRNEFTTGVGIHFRVAKRTKSGKCALDDFRLEGTWTVGLNQATQRTRIIFRPSELLPGNSCVVVRINDKPSGVDKFRLIRDLKGNPAPPTRLEFGTEAAAVKVFSITEDFADPAVHRDTLRDGFAWAKGAAVPGRLGGSAVLGDFTLHNSALYKQGVKVLRRNKQGEPLEVEVDASKVVVPSFLSLSGVDQAVNNGILEFASIQVADGETVRFIGDTPPVLKASGKIVIEGSISVSAPDAKAPAYSSSTGRPVNGQPGQPGGPGGASGGQGGALPFNTPTSIGPIDGRDGQAVQLPAGHPLTAAVALTGGRGSKALPIPNASATTKANYDKQVGYSALSGYISQQCSAGGGGGGFLTVGMGGKVVDNKLGTSGSPTAADFGLPSLGGSAVDISSLFTRSESSGFLFGFGGSGGGGAGLNPMGSVKQTPVTWSSGSGGAGGGGFLWIKAGTDLVLGNRGKLLSRGGKAPTFGMDTTNMFAPAAAGGGSGGAILLQSGGTPDLRGEINVLGGAGGKMSPLSSYSLRVDSLGGDGGAGFVRVEADPAPDYKSFLNFQPAASAKNAGKLKDVDSDSASMLFTNFYRTGLLFPPTYTAYLVKAKIGSQTVLFSDDPSRSTVKAEAGQPVVFFIQSAQASGKQLKNLSPWYMGEVDSLNLRGGNSFRFSIRVDRSKTSQPVEIQSVQVFYQS
ncbi:MAG: hypothetical protein CSA62_03435 [Planctomycetota bacterium]|nr:MAG: hypothetical protein CSA62_03435 [Planctomycetota bacterium]